jgi:hypothetical protein
MITRTPKRPVAITVTALSAGLGCSIGPRLDHVDYSRVAWPRAGRAHGGPGVSLRFIAERLVSSLSRVRANAIVC